MIRFMATALLVAVAANVASFWGEWPLLAVFVGALGGYAAGWLEGSGEFRL